MNKIDQVVKIMKLADSVAKYDPKIMTTLFSSSNFQSAISCGVTANLIKNVLLESDIGDEIDFDTDHKLNPKKNRVYLITILGQVSEKDHVFVLYVDSNGKTYAFQSDCYTGESLMSFYKKENKFLGKSKNSFEINLAKIINKINNMSTTSNKVNCNNAETLMKMMTQKDFSLTQTEKEQLVGKALVDIKKIGVGESGTKGWLEKTMFYKKMKQALDD